MAQTVNLQIATFAGLGLPRTLNKPVPATASTRDVLETIYAALPNPELGPRLLISTTDGRRLRSDPDVPISTFLSSSESSLLPLRLSSRLCGGKGGFGSQLRAAGGRMSSKKNRDRQNANGSNRNLDGRRLRTVDEAKRLAQYLELKPEMERKEKEERRARWEAVVQAAEETEEKIRSGKLGSNQGRLNAEYVEGKELAEEKVRDAIAKAMKDGILQTERTGSESSKDDSEGSDDDMQPTSSNDSDEAGPSFYGWDDDDDEDDLNDDDDESVIDTTENHAITVGEANEASRVQLDADLQTASYAGKGKGKAAAA